MGGLIVMFAAIGVVPLLMWSTARSRLAFVRQLVRDQPWPIVEAYTAGNRGYVAMKIADRRVTLSFGQDKGTPAMIVRVDLPVPGLPHFDIAPQALISRLTLDPLAGDTVKLGHEYFDEVFRTRSREPAVARTLWTAELCHQFRAALPPASVRGDAEAVVLGVDGIATEDLAVRAVKVALDIACAGVYGLDVLRALPGATPRLDEFGCCVEFDGPSPIRIRPQRDGNTVYTLATVDEGELSGERPDTTALGDDVTIIPAGTGIAISWPGVETDRAHLIAAIDLLRNVRGAPHEGAYR